MGKIQFNVFCPNCDGDHRKKHLNINLNKNVFCCPKCESGGSAIALYGFFTKGIDPQKLKIDADLKKDLIREISSKLGSSEKVETIYAPISEFIEEVPPTDIEDRNKTYALLLDMLTLNETHKNDLLSRGLTEEDIKKGGYKSTPQLMLKNIPTKLRLSGANLYGVPGFYKENDNWSLIQATTGYFVPVRDIQGRIQGMQIRADKPGVSKYMWLSSGNNEEGCGAKTWSHFVGYPERSVILTEGPLKADIINKFLDRPVIAVPGVNALKNLKPVLLELKSLGVEEILTAFDMDFLSNDNVRAAYAKLITLIDSCELRYRKLMWDPEYKGYDDYLYHIYQTNNNTIPREKSMLF